MGARLEARIPGSGFLRIPMSEDTSASLRRPAPSLDRVRSEIDALDAELVRLLAQREACVRDVARQKATDPSLPGLDAERERAQLAAWTERARAHGLSGTLAQRVLREILVHSRRSQEPALRGACAPRAVRVVFQGEPLAYSDLAASRLMATRHAAGAERRGVPTFAAAVAAVRRKEADYAFLPVENSCIGAIEEVTAVLLDEGLSIVDEEIGEVRHVLAARPGTALADVRRVRSHPAALAQCRTALARLGALPEPWHDTAGAAADLAREDERTAAGCAVICSREAAAAHGLVVLAEDVADDPQNVTRFVLLAREPEPAPRGVPIKTSLAVLLDHRRGALARFLQELAAAGVNLTRIESRPRPRTPWQYEFLVDFEGTLADGARALERARLHCNVLRVLGSYPARTRGEPHLDAAFVAAPEAPRPADPAAAAAPAPPERVVVEVGAARIGSERFTLIAGPCAALSREQVQLAAAIVRARGASVLRGGVLHPRSEPRTLQGLGGEGLRLLAEAGRSVGLPVVTEVLRIEDLDDAMAHADMLQIGARNMQNVALLEAVGRTRLPVLLERGPLATIQELLAAADCVLAEGNRQVVLCERGIRTFESATRSTLDLSAVAVLKRLTPLPVIVDPTHAAGRRELVVPLALAAAAVGADGILVETHASPEPALGGEDPSLGAEDLDRLASGLAPILASQGRSL